MNRRGFLAASLAASAAPCFSAAQQAGKVHRVALLTQAEPVDAATGKRHRFWAAFFDELRRLGYDEASNLTVEWRSSAGDAKHRSELAGQIARLKPDAIFTPDFAMTLALKAAAVTIPTVAVVVYPVELGLAVSLARPGGNFTGFSIEASAGLMLKRIALLKEAFPTASRMAWLAASRSWENTTVLRTIREAAEVAAITIIPAGVDAPADEVAYRRAFAAISRDRADCLHVAANAENYVHRYLIAGFASETRLPAICGFRENAEAGALMAYAADLDDIFRRAGGYVDQILKGANPAEMPFQQPTKFELVINVRTAKALGLTVPESILLQADTIIE